MKVVQVCDIRTNVANGVYKTAAGLAAALPRAGVDVEAWNFSRDATHVDERQVMGVRVFDLPARGRGRSFLLGLPAVTRRFIAARQRQFDLVHFHSVFIADNVSAAGALHVPYVVTSHGGYAGRVLDGSNRAFKRAWLAWRERQYLRRARVVHAVSEAEGRELSARWPDLTVRCVPNAVDLPPPPGEAPPVTKDFVFVGRLAIDAKGLDLMIRGFARFAKTSSAAGFRLILAGPDWHGSRATLERMVVEQGVADRVILPGPVFGDEMARLVGGARAFVHTSRWEGLPFALLEAMSHGTPVLVTPETNVGDVVNRYKAGLECCGDEASIAKAFAAFAQATEAEHGGLRRAARRLVEENFTWPVVTRQVVQMYEQAVAGGRVTAVAGMSRRAAGAGVA